MSATERLFFPPTGDETSFYLRVDVSRDGEGALLAESSLQEPQPIPEGAEHPPAFPGRKGDLAAVLGEAIEFAEPRGYPVRVRLPEGVDFPPALGTYAERRTAG